METAFMSGAQQFNTTQEFGNYIGQRFSETMLSRVVAVTVPTSNIAEQTRERLLVTRLPKAPFFALVIFNLLYGSLGIILAILVLTSRPRKVRRIQVRLSICGLVVALLEPSPIEQNGAGHKKSTSRVEALFAEYYNEDKHRDSGRILVNPNAGNAVFERVSVETVTTNHKANASTVSTSKTPADGAPSPLSGGNHDGGAERTIPRVKRSTVRRKPLAQRSSLSGRYSPRR